MKVVKLFQYYGGKFHLVPDIIKEIGYAYTKYDIKCVVDVFGGSGTVILSLPQEWNVNRVYNDLDLRLYKTLKVLQNETERNKVLDFLKWSLESRKVFEDFKVSDWNSLTDVEVAQRYLYLLSNSFNGDTTSYSFKVNKIRSVISQVLNNITHNFKYLQKYLNVENLDFRELIKKYKGKNTFFYLDPPYLKSGKSYKYSFDIQDFRDLKDALDNSGSYWLMNESKVDFEALKHIFGEPNYKKEYVNSTVNSKQIKMNNGKKSIRLEGFWRNYEKN